MDDLPAGSSANDVSRCWKHDLRNAVNSATLALHVAERMLELGNAKGARDNVRRASEACNLMTELLDAPAISPPSN